MAKGVTSATSNADRVKVGDYGSQITIRLDNIDNQAIEEIEWVRASPANESTVTKYVDIPEHKIEDGNLIITLPEIARGTYNLEIKDTEGRIYPAEGVLRLEMLSSTKDAAELYYITYKEAIIEDVKPLIEDYINDNPDNFRGVKGDTNIVPPKVYTREEYDNLTSYDTNTLYIVKEVE